MIYKDPLDSIYFVKYKIKTHKREKNNKCDINEKIKQSS